MNKRNLKKLLGTSVLIVVAGVVALTATGHAQALFDYTNNRLNVSGEVTSLGNKTFTMDVSGSDGLTVKVTRDTDFKGGYKKFSDMHVGDNVRVRSTKRDKHDPANKITAEQVRKLKDVDTYGADCDKFKLEDGYYQPSDIDGTFYVVKGNIKVLVHYDEDTRIRGGELDDIRPGEKVQVDVRGDDCRATDTLYADKIVLTTRNNHNWHGSHHRDDWYRHRGYHNYGNGWRR